MTQPGSAAGGDRTPPLAQDLDAVQVRYTWKFTEAGKARAPAVEMEPEGAAEADADELARLRAQVAQFTTALEDIVTLALSSADYKERAIMMHRRAVAALSTLGVPSPGTSGK